MVCRRVAGVSGALRFRWALAVQCSRRACGTAGPWSIKQLNERKDFCRIVFLKTVKINTIPWPVNSSSYRHGEPR